MSLNLSNLSTVISDLGTIPGGLSILGNHLSQSNEVKAIQIIDSMAANQNNPTLAQGFSTQLALIPNMPATVMNYVNTALDVISNASMYAQNLAEAKNALLAAVSSGIAGALGL